LIEEGKLEFYCTRSQDKELELRWHSDGDDGPEWPAGIAVEKVKVELSKAEEEYITNSINKWSLKTQCHQ